MHIHKHNIIYGLYPFNPKSPKTYRNPNLKYIVYSTENSSTAILVTRKNQQM